MGSFPHIGDLVDAKSAVSGWSEAVVLAHRDKGGNGLQADPAHAAGNAEEAGGVPGEDPGSDAAAGEGQGIAVLLARTEFFVHFKGWSSDLDGWVSAPESMAPLHTHTRRWREALDVGSLCEANFGASARGRSLWRLSHVVYVSKVSSGATNAVCVRYVAAERDGGAPPFLRFWLDVSCDRLCPAGTHVRANVPESIATSPDATSPDASSDESTGMLEDEDGSGLAALWRSNTLTDFTVFVSDMSFKVHKLVLAARSDVFRSMLTGPLREASENEVTFDDISPQTFERILRFLYTGKVDCGGDPRGRVTALFTLILAADRFHIRDLMAKCEEVLQNCLDVDNVVKVVALARRFQLERLESVASEFFVTYARRVLKSGDFCNLLTHVPIELDDGALASPLVNAQKNPVKRLAPAAMDAAENLGFTATKRPRRDPPLDPSPNG